MHVRKLGVCQETYRIVPKKEATSITLTLDIRKDLAARKTRLSEVNKSFKGQYARFYNKIAAEIQNLPLAEFKGFVKRNLYGKGYYTASEYLNEKALGIELLGYQVHPGGAADINYMGKTPTRKGRTTSTGPASSII
ncbi:hypothetical protein EVAR_5346_1 [Eumeta japonica]|uniref:Uncharacterized protein n=1 Tax=Eumeta variegata TaxID=151549 RepID=A0A4C1TMB1_EUMVA|nr:hypothetical protein EVAR_5346_1 [Eumeta japonica]